MTRKRIILFVILGAVALIIIASAIGIPIMINRADENMAELTELTIEDIDLTSLADGEYKASYNAFTIAVEVRTRVNNHKITCIDLVKHINGQGGEAESILETVLEKQSLLVDTVSGATYSSKAILKAIEIALKKGIN